ncbi:MAG: hypothetical protein IJX77_09815 [Ruminococcus sp.]|nr:hypothetical protein [Ruminococcus sp.]
MPVFSVRLFIKSVSAGAFFTAYVYWGTVFAWHINTMLAMWLFAAAGLITAFLLWEEKFARFIVGCGISFAATAGLYYLYMNAKFLDKFYQMTFGLDTPVGTASFAYGFMVLVQIGTFALGLLVCFCIAVTGSFGADNRSDSERAHASKLKNIQFVISVILLAVSVLLTLWQSRYHLITG